MSRDTQTVPVEVVDNGKPTVGRKLKYPTPKLLKVAVDSFFKTEPYPTLTGLARHIGLTREGVRGYKQREEYADIIKEAAQKVEEMYEKRLIYGNGKNQAGIIFALRVGMKWERLRPTEGRCP